MPLTTPWSRSFQLNVPIVNAPMGGAAGGNLAAAVSAAGGLGMIGIGSAGSSELLEREAAIPRRAGLRFGIGLIAWAVERDPQLLDAAIAVAPDLIAVSFGEPDRWPDAVRDAGIATATQVYDTAMALRAEQNGVEILVARGSEGGGHGANEVATLPLLQGVLELVTAPVLAAGGIASGRGLAAVLAAGASGAWLGTCFAACVESMFSDEVRHRIVSAGERDTLYTRAFDAAMGYPWPTRYGERVLTDEPAEHRRGPENEPAGQRPELTQLPPGDDSSSHINAGQGVGLVTTVRPAAEVVRQLSDEAAALLSRF